MEGTGNLTAQEGQVGEVGAVLPDTTVGGSTVENPEGIQGPAVAAESGAPVGFVAQPGVPEYQAPVAEAAPLGPDDQPGTLPVPETFKRDADAGVVPAAEQIATGSAQVDATAGLGATSVDTAAQAPVESGLLVGGVPAGAAAEPVSHKSGFGVLGELLGGLIHRGKAVSPVQVSTTTIPSPDASAPVVASTDPLPTPQAS